MNPKTLEPIKTRAVGRKCLLAAIALLLPEICIAAVFGAEQPADPPNIIVILADDLGCGDLSACDAADLQTPHIDRLMESGMRFDQFYANCPVCSPTRAALFSGKYPDKVGVPGVIRTHAQSNWGFLSPNTILLPQALGAASYHTALIGKWHLGLESPNTPNERGFDFFHGFLGDMMDDYYHHRRPYTRCITRSSLQARSGRCTFRTNARLTFLGSPSP